MYRSKSLFTSKLRVFDLDGVTNRSEELLPGVHSPIHQHNTRLTSRGLRYDPNHFRLHKSFWIRDKFDQGVMPPRAYNWYFFSCRLWKYFFIVFRIILHKSSKRNYQITTSTHVYRLSYSWGSFENTRIWPFLFWKPLSILHLIVMHENFFMCLRLRWLISEKSWYGLTFHFPHRIKPLYNTI